MLVTARSPAFIQPAAEAGPGAATVLRAAALKGHRPWFVLTYLTEDEGSGAWETVCTLDLTDLLVHMKGRPQAQLAHLLMMSPPRWNTKRKWSCFRIDLIEMGKCRGAEVLVYHVAGGGTYCFDAPEVEPDEVKHRRCVLHIDWFNHFDK